jgi:hypothetical protein
VSDRIEVMRAKFERFARVECRGRSPLYAEISLAITGDDEILALFGHTPHRQRRPNLLLAAMHFLLLGGADHPLAAHVPTVAGRRVPAGTAGEQALAFCREHANELARLLATRSTQTNEVNRCSALLPALAVATPPGRPLRLVELGASAGLNLLLDRFAYRYDGAAPSHVGDGAVECACTVDGTLPRLDGLPAIAERVGIDLNPIDVCDEDEARWLLACVFADQPRRVQRLRAALEVARAVPPRLVRGDGPSLASALLLDAGDDAVHPVLWHSVALSYTYESQQRALTESLDRAGAQTDVTWIFLEGPEGRVGLPPLEIRERREAPEYALVAVTYRGGRRSARQLAAVDPHATSMTWMT